MPTYAMLTTLGPDGWATVRENPERIREVTREVGFELPQAHAYAVGTAFLPADPEAATKVRRRIEEIAAEEGLVHVLMRDGALTADEAERLPRASVRDDTGRVVGAISVHD